MSTSHQNVKQMADQLVQRGYLKIVRDRNDRRILRLKTTEKNALFWSSKRGEHEEFMVRLFNSLNPDELMELNHLLLLLSKGISEYIEQ